MTPAPTIAARRFNPVGSPPPARPCASTASTVAETTATVAIAPVTTPPPPPAPPKPASGVAKLSFGKMAAKKEETKTAYPVLPDPHGNAASIAARLIERTAEYEALGGAIETDKAELKMFATPFYFEANRSRAEVPSSISVNSPFGEVLVTFQNRYKTLPDEAPLVPILGEATGTHFKQAFELKISGDKLPVDRAQELLDRLQELFTEFNCVDALEANACIKPTKDFHTARHTLFTPEQNLALDAACPIIAMIKTKGRGGKK